MKVGDAYTIRLDEHEVGQAIIESIEDGQATLVIPATRIVMGVKSSLAAPPERVPEVDRVFGGVAETPDNTPSEAQRQVNEQPGPVAQPQVEVPVHNEQQSQPSQSNYVAPDQVGNGLRGVELDSSILD